MIVGSDGQLCSSGRSTQRNPNTPVGHRKDRNPPARWMRRTSTNPLTASEPCSRVRTWSALFRAGNRFAADLAIRVDGCHGRTTPAGSQVPRAQRCEFAPSRRMTDNAPPRLGPSQAGKFATLQARGHEVLAFANPGQLVAFCENTVAKDRGPYQCVFSSIHCSGCCV